MVKTQHTADGGSLKNCVVFYSPNPLPDQLEPYYVGERMRRFQDRLDATVASLADVGPIDLTELAGKIYTNYPGPQQGRGQQPNRWMKLRAIAVLPEPLDGSAPYGLVSPNGLIVDVFRSIFRLDLNGPSVEVHLRFLALFPAREWSIVPG